MTWAGCMRGQKAYARSSFASDMVMLAMLKLWENCEGVAGGINEP